MIEAGFSSLKVDGCGTEKNVSLFAEIFNKSGTPVLLENCHEGAPRRRSDGSVQCEMNVFRTSADIRPTYGSIVTNLLTVDKYNAAGLTGPGCWAYPGALWSACIHTQFASNAFDRGLTCCCLRSQ